jgi:small-conductance mechanosensitive channel
MDEIRANPHFIGLVIALVMYVSLFFIKKIFFSQLDKIINRTSNRVDDVLVYSFAHTTHIFMLVCSAYMGFQFMPEHHIYPTWSWRIFFVVMMMQVGIWGLYGIKKWMQLSFNRKRKRDPASASSINIVELMLKFTFLAIVFMFTLHNIGIQVTTMIAGLGIGGVAIALAMQNILGDLFSSLSIILDKPFVVGDFIILGEWLGEVEHIGLKTTRIRSLGGEQIIMSNSDLLGSRIRNMKRMHERRSNFFISLPHESTPEEIKRAVEIITAVVLSKKQIRFDRCHFFRITTHSLDIEVVYFVLTDDYNIHMDIQQSILLDVHQVFRAENIDYAYPVQKTHFFSLPPHQHQNRTTLT